MIYGYPYVVINNVPMTCVTYHLHKDDVDGTKLILVNTMTEWRAFYELLMKERYVEYDTETTGFRHFDGDKIVGMSFGWRDMDFYIPVRHEASELGGAPPQQLNMEDLKEDLQAFFYRTDVIICGHNAATFDKLFYEVEGIDMSKVAFLDTLFMWKLLDENSSAKLKDIASGWRDRLGRWHKGVVGKGASSYEKELDNWRLAESKARRKVYMAAVRERAVELRARIEFTGWNLNKLKAHVKETDAAIINHPYRDCGKEDVHYGCIPVEMMFKYAAMDTFICRKVREFCLPQLMKDKKLWEIYTYELKLSKVLMKAEQVGAPINRPYLEDLLQQYNTSLNNVAGYIQSVLVNPEKGIYSVNLNSTDDLVKAFLAQGIPLTERTDKNKLKLDKKVLEKLAEKYPIAQSILDYRKEVKLRDTYVVGILDKLTPTNYLHGSFNQNVTTGRLSSKSPNLQNIPRTDDAIRKAFVCAGEEWVLVYADYSQIEVRLTGHYSKDPVLIEAYKLGRDVHLSTACSMFGLAYDEWVKIYEDKEHPDHKKIKQLRSTAKCVHPDTLIYKDGYLSKVGSLGMPRLADTFGAPIEPVKTQTGAGNSCAITQTYNGGVKPLLHVVTRGGILTCSENHRFKMRDGSLVRAADLVPGQLLEIPDIAEECASRPIKSIKASLWSGIPESQYDLNEDWAYLAGVYAGDGTSNINSVHITHGPRGKLDCYGNDYGVWIDSIAESCRLCGLTPVERKSHTTYLGSKVLVRLFQELGLASEKGSKHFSVPEWVLSSGREGMMQYLAGLLDADGSVGKRNSLTMVTKDFIFGGQILAMLRSLGMNPSTDASYNKTYKRHYVKISLPVCDSYKFKNYLRHIGKANALKPPALNASTKDRFEVRKILPAGNLQCMDISVDTTDHLYVANGCITHNTINFAIIYGAAAKGLSEQITPRPDQYAHYSTEGWIRVCEGFIDDYFSALRGVKRFIKQSQRDARRNKQVRGEYGRIRRLPEVDAVKITKDPDKKWLEGKAARQATNSIVQGSAADIMKRALVRIDKILEGYKSHITNTVHDEVQIMMHRSELHLLPAIKQAMEDFPELVIPMEAEFEFSTTNWAEKKGMHIEEAIEKYALCA